MRVIAGKFKGRRLLCPPGKVVRPTADAMKETVFNVLGDRVEGVRAIDLFAGVGSLGIEALSRGAHLVHFIERDPRALEYLSRNLKAAGVAEEALILKGDALAWIRRLYDRGERYGLLLADPPYGSGMADRLLCCEEERPLLVDGSTLVLQHHAKERIRECSLRYLVETQRSFGDTVVTFLIVREAKS